MATMFEYEGRERRRRESLMFVKIVAFLVFAIVPSLVNKEVWGTFTVRGSICKRTCLECMVEDPIGSIHCVSWLFSHQSCHF